MDKLLSICMIVRNEEKNLPRCLDSLLPLTHQDWCELIICDTGSTDDTVQIAEHYTVQYTDKNKICFYEWNNDFSAARNFGITFAHGRHILPIDADEEMPQETAKIIREFLGRDETIFMKIRSFASSDGSKYHDLLQPRLFLNDGQSLYSGAIHNKPRVEPPYLFAPEAVIYHYGYLLSDRGLLQRKIERSLPILLAQYERDLHDLHSLTHIIKSYATVNQPDKVLQYGEAWLREIQTVEYNEGWYAYLEVFVSIVWAELARGNILGALRVKEFAEKFTDDLIAIYFAIGNYYSSHHQHDEAAKYFEQGIIAHRKENPYRALLTSNVELMIPEVLNWLSIYYFKRQEYERAGMLVNEGILKNQNKLPLRWDIWNESEAHKMLK